jgi:hypothetical protein
MKESQSRIKAKKPQTEWLWCVFNMWYHLSGIKVMQPQFLSVRKNMNTNSCTGHNHTIFFYYLVCEAIGTAATPGLLLMKMIVKKQMECRLVGETEVLGEHLPQRHFCPSQNPTWPDLGLNPGCCSGKLVTNWLSYGAATITLDQGTNSGRPKISYTKHGLFTK